MTTKPKLIFLTSAAPKPPLDGAKIRDSQILKLLSAHYEIEILDSSEIPQKNQHLLKRVVGSIRPYVMRAYNLGVDQALKNLRTSSRLVWISRLNMAKYIPIAKQLGYQVILDEHNVETDLWLRTLAHTPKAWHQIPQAIQCGFFERKACRMADYVVTTSKRDAELLRRYAGLKNLMVIPNPIDCESYASIRDQQGSTILFTGTLSYYPNIEGIDWFLDNSLPILRSKLQNKPLRVVVAGSNPSSELRKKILDSEVELCANPDSMLPILADAAIVFVPLFSGGGTRLKILEALAAKRAVVSTKKGAEGLDLQNRTELIIANDAHSFADAILELLDDPNKRNQLAKSGYQKVNSTYDWRQLKPLILELSNHLERK